MDTALAEEEVAGGEGGGGSGYDLKVQYRILHTKTNTHVTNIQIQTSFTEFVIILTLQVGTAGLITFSRSDLILSGKLSMAAHPPVMTKLLTHAAVKEGEEKEEKEEKGEEEEAGSQYNKNITHTAYCIYILYIYIYAHNMTYISTHRTPTCTCTSTYLAAPGHI